MSYEVNFDGLVGPTHLFSGLSQGNIPSMKHKNKPSNPKQAALEGLEKMYLLTSLGVKQGIFLPQERPHLSTLRQLGFEGSDEQILQNVSTKHPELFTHFTSSSSMWAANAAISTPSVDSLDHHLHFTPANLATKLHRAIEVPFTQKMLKVIFNNPVYFKHHPPVAFGQFFSDEGAANHIRLCKDFDKTGIHLFVYGRLAFKENQILPQKFPARQSREAQEFIAKSHEIPPERVVFAQQSPRAIDAGVFHNDLVATSYKNLILYHEDSYIGGDGLINEIEKKMEKLCYCPLIKIKVKKSSISLDDAVASFFFNSQIVETLEGNFVLISPVECETMPAVNNFINTLLKDPSNPIGDVHYVRLNESMANGGGPACLRLRVNLKQVEYDQINPKLWMNDLLYQKLKNWVEKYYRDSLTIKDLSDPNLLKESKEALDALTKLLNLGSIYDFQQ